MRVETRMTSFYGRTWRNTSEAVRLEQDWCAFCRITAGEEHMSADGEVKVARMTVDHIVPLSRGGTSDRSNVRVLCAACHGQLTSGNKWRTR